MNSAPQNCPPFLNSAQIMCFHNLKSLWLIFFVILNEQCPTNLSPIFEQCANDCSKFCTARDMIFSQFWAVRNSFFHNFWMNSAWLIFLQKFEQWATHLQILYSVWLIFSKFNLWKVCDSFFHNFEIIMNSGQLMFPTILNSARLIFSNFGTVRVSFFHNFEQCASLFPQF